MISKSKEHYLNTVQFDQLYQDHIINVMQTPKIEKIVLSMGLGQKAVKDPRNIIFHGLWGLELLSNQKACTTYSKKSVDKFKLRKNNVIGCKVNIRKKNMFRFLDVLIYKVLPFLCKEYPLQVPKVNGINKSLVSLCSYNSKRIKNIWKSKHSRKHIQKSTGFGIVDFFAFKETAYEQFEGISPGGFNININIKGPKKSKTNESIYFLNILKGLEIPYPDREDQVSK